MIKWTSCPSSNASRNRGAMLIALLLLLPESRVSADQGIWDTAQVHGFISQSWLKSGENNFFGNSSRSGGSWEFSEFGLNGSIRPIANVQLSGQVIGRRAGESDPGSVGLDYAFADWNMLSTETGFFGTRFGRVKIPLAFYNDTRDVAFTRPSILLPQSIYFDAARALALSSDGVQFYGEARSEDSTLTLQTNIGYPRVEDEELEIAIHGREVPGTMDSQLSFLARGIYDYLGGQWRFGATYGNVHAKYEAKPTDILPSVGDFRFKPLVLSGQFNGERVGITAEYALRRTELEDFMIGGIDLGLPPVEFTGVSYYIQGTYRFSPQVEGLLRYDVLHIDRKNRHGGCLLETNLGFPDHACYAKDWTFGLTWNVTPKVMLRGEYHMVNGTGWLTRKDNPRPTETEKNWNLFAIEASFRF